MLRLSHNKIQNSVVLSSGPSGGLVHLQRLELQGNKISGCENLPDGLPNLEVLYLQEFDLTAANPICAKPRYETDVYKKFPKLRALDGLRKSVKMDVKMNEALPEMDLDEAEYEVDHEEWFNQIALKKSRPEAEFFEPTIPKMREEQGCQSEIKTMKALLNRHTNVLLL